MGFGQWLRAFTDRRRAPRRPAVGLEAVYWNGGVAHPWPVIELSLSGAVIETPDNWYPGTMMHLVLERNGGGEDACVCGVWARVVRMDNRGVCVEFVPRDAVETAWLKSFVTERRQTVEHKNITKALLLRTLAR